MISREDARWIVGALDPARLARLTYRAAARGLATEASGGEGGAPFRLAAVVLDLEDGALRVEVFHAEGGVEMRPNLVVLAYADSVLVEDAERRYGEGATLPPSPEVLAEEVGRAVEDGGVGVSWRAIETQLRIVYETEATADSETGERGQ